MSQRKIYSINSDNKINGTSNDFQALLQTHPSDNKFNRMSLLSCLISKTYFNILSTDRLTLTDSVNPAGAPVFVPSGFYTATSFAAALASALNVVSASTNYTVFINSLTLTMVIDNSVEAFTINAGKYLAQYIGIVQDVILSSVADEIVGTRMLNMQRYSELQIHCNLANNFNDDILYTVFPSGDAIGDITFTAEDPEATSVVLTDNRTNIIKITVTDGNGLAVDFNDQDIKLILLMWEQK